MAMLQRDDTIGRSSDLTPTDACAPFGFAVGESPLRSIASAAHLSSMPSCMVTRKRPNASAKSCAG